MIKFPLRCPSSGENVLKCPLQCPSSGENVMKRPLGCPCSGENCRLFTINMSGLGRAAPHTAGAAVPQTS